MGTQGSAFPLTPWAGIQFRPQVHSLQVRQRPSPTVAVRLSEDPHEAACTAQVMGKPRHHRANPRANSTEGPHPRAQFSSPLMRSEQGLDCLFFFLLLVNSHVLKIYFAQEIHSATFKRLGNVSSSSLVTQCSSGGNHFCVLLEAS